mmetsp:Transcript_57158/g.66819  ORF Transcript_57158/g.66819 Transcript_57158/m.66819 type:complete len:99 (+) Transcript_57158:498-794(+)
MIAAPNEGILCVSGKMLLKRIKFNASAIFSLNVRCQLKEKIKLIFFPRAIEFFHSGKMTKKDSDVSICVRLSQCTLVGFPSLKFVYQFSNEAVPLHNS